MEELTGEIQVDMTNEGSVSSSCVTSVFLKNSLSTAQISLEPHTLNPPLASGIEMVRCYRCPHSSSICMGTSLTSPSDCHCTSLLLHTPLSQTSSHWSPQDLIPDSDPVTSSFQTPSGAQAHFHLLNILSSSFSTF